MTSSSRPRIALLTASVGSGHVRAAQAAAAALRQHAEPEGAARTHDMRIQVFDALEDSSAAFRTLYRDGYLALVRHAPRLVGMLYDGTDRARSGPSDPVRRAIQRRALSRFSDRLAAFAPDLVVSTHFLTSEWFAWMRRRRVIECPMVTVVTDLHPHAIWLHGPCEAVCVSSDSAAGIVRAAARAECAEVTGIPIDPEFARSLTRDDAALAIGDARDGIGGGPVDPERRRVLFSTGGCCVGPVRQMWSSLLDLPHDIEVVAICGHSARAKASLDSLARDRGAEDRVRVIGFTDRMHAWMAASDALVGKPGGLTSAECRARGLPMVIACAVPGQEDRNAHCMERWGCAIRCPSPSDAGAVVRSLMDDRQRLAAMSASALAHAQPHSAQDVAAVVHRVSGITALTSRACTMTDMSRRASPPRASRASPMSSAPSPASG
jgi:processive 1,2-diacylglycerol beta-glucosyltransferase